MMASPNTESIRDFFEDSTILVTGATGFLGHVLLSKLLSECQDIRRIYVIIREKKGKPIHSRFDEIFKEPIFKKLKSKFPNFSSKLVAIRGDCEEPELGMSKSDQRLLENEVNVVFHVAATVNFYAPLKQAVEINIRCTDYLLSMAKNMKKLQAFVHVSTAFSFCAERTIIEERVYEPPVDPKAIVHFAEHMPESTLDKITSKLVEPFPNTYAYTKAIAEKLCLERASEIPVIIFRPTVVMCTADEPIPGWINNMYGPTGIMMSVGLGMMHSLHTCGNCRADIVPCDYVINAMIASAWYTAKTWKIYKNNDPTNPEPIAVYNYSNSGAVTWGNFVDESMIALHAAPFSKTKWYVTFEIYGSRTITLIYRYILHSTPAFIADSLATLLGKKARLQSTFEKMHKFSDAISYFSTRSWTIENNNVRKLWNNLSDEEKKIFNFELSNLNWSEYFQNHIYGIRMYLLKDDADTLPEAIRKTKRFRFLHYFLTVVLWSMVFYFLYKLVNVI